MSRPLLQTFVFVLVGLCLATSHADAATQLRKSVAASGGGNAEGYGYRVRGTLGQHSVGTSYINYPAAVNVGYWFDADSEPPTAVEATSYTRAFAFPPNRPNPFNPSTSIRFSLPSPMYTTIRVYDVAGRLIATIADENFEAGPHILTFNAAELASGVYFCRIVAGSFSATQKLVLLK